MILFVFEGKKREPDIFEPIKQLFFTEQYNTGNVICAFENNIYHLYQSMVETHFEEDIVSILLNKYKNKPENPLKDYKRNSDFAEIFLFFDYEPHHQKDKLTIDCLNSQLDKLLSFFTDETDRGKLYINYPMVESIRYTKKLPDSDFFLYKIKIDQCSEFKTEADRFSFYKNLDFIFLKKCVKNRCKIEKNWEYLIEQNVRKANYICTDVNKYPFCLDDISQYKIFLNQLDKYVKPEAEVAILNAFPIFLFERLNQTYKKIPHPVI